MYRSEQFEDHRRTPPPPPISTNIEERHTKIPRAVAFAWWRTESNYAAEEGLPCEMGWGCSSSRLRAHIANKILVSLTSSVFRIGRKYFHLSKYPLGLHGKKGRRHIVFMISIDLSWNLSKFFFKHSMTMSLNYLSIRYLSNFERL